VETDSNNGAPGEEVNLCNSAQTNISSIDGSSPGTESNGPEGGGGIGEGMYPNIDIEKTLSSSSIETI